MLPPVQPQSAGVEGANKHEPARVRWRDYAQHEARGYSSYLDLEVQSIPSPLSVGDRKGAIADAGFLWYHEEHFEQQRRELQSDGNGAGKANKKGGSSSLLYSPAQRGDSGSFSGAILRTSTAGGGGQGGGMDGGMAKEIVSTPSTTEALGDAARIREALIADRIDVLLAASAESPL